MHKELQKYNYCGKNNKAPDVRDRFSAYRPEWHEAGSIKIDNPKELEEKLIRDAESTAIHKYYQSLYNKRVIWWHEILVDGDKMPAGAVYSKEPSGVKNNKPGLLVCLHSNGINESFSGVRMNWLLLDLEVCQSELMGHIWGGALDGYNYRWEHYNSEKEYYAAIVENRY